MSCSKNTYVRKMRYARALTFGFVLLFTAGSASAATVAECKGLIDIARGDLADVLILGGNPDQTRRSLESKLGGAKTKLEQYKACDAYTKLVQAQDKVMNLAAPNAKGEVKICNPDPVDPTICDVTDPNSEVQTLLDDIGAAIACVLELDPTCDDLVQ